MLGGREEHGLDGSDGLTGFYFIKELLLYDDQEKYCFFNESFCYE